MPEIVITEFMKESVVADLAKDYDVHFDVELWEKRAELETLVRDATALIVRNRTQVDRALIDAAPKLKVIGRLGVGLDNLDVPYCEKKGIPIRAARGANANSVAEYVITSAMILLRGRFYMSSDRLAAGQWPRQELGQGLELDGKRLGVIGLGSIGSTTASKARALGMVVSAYDPLLPSDNPAWALAKPATLDEILGGSDVITLHIGLSEETRGMLGAAELGRMKKGAILINAARGGIVDEAACAAALKSGHLGGAAIDVFDQEPIAKEVGALFAGIPNVILTPHVSGATRESNDRVSSMTVDAVREILRGQS